MPKKSKVVKKVVRSRAERKYGSAHYARSVWKTAREERQARDDAKVEVNNE